MLEKNKDYIEMRVSSTDFAFTQNEPVHLCVEGLVDATNGRFPGPGEDYILISKEKFEALQTENEQLKKKLTTIQTLYALNEFDPIPEFKELLKKLYSTDDAENLEWVLNHTCGGRGSVNGWIAVSLFWKQKYETLCKLSGFSSVEEVQEYLTNNGECDTLQEAILKLRDEVTYTCEKLASANSENNSWKATAECNSPKVLMTKLNLLHGSIKEWKGLYDVIRAANKKLTDDVVSWKNVTGYSTPEDLLSATINKTVQSALSWQEATGCDTPEQAKERIKALNKSIDESEADYNHLLMLTGFESDGEIEDALDKCDHSTLRKALVDYEFDYENLLKLTGYKSEHDIRVLLNDSEQFVYENMRELINSLKREAKFTESNWQHATGCDTPGRAEEKLEFYKERLGKAVQAASCAAKHLENIMS